MEKAKLDEREMVRLYRAGWKLAALGARYAVHRNTIRNRLLSLGEPLRDTAAVERINQHGYVTIFRPGHPMARPNGDVLLHRLVMAESLGRALEPHETVHHIDGNKLNNDLPNLQLRAGRHGKHGCYECADCGSHNIRAVPLD